MKVYAIQSEDGKWLGKRTKVKGIWQRLWTKDAPDLWHRHQAAVAAGNSVFGKYKIVSLELTMNEAA